MENEIYDMSNELWGGFSKGLTDLIKRLLCPNEEERISAKEAGNSEWLKGLLG